MITGLGMKLKLARTKKQLSQQQAADLIGLESGSTISTYETGTATPSAEILMKLATLYNESVDYLLGIEKRKAIYFDELSDRQIEIVKTVVGEFKTDDEK